MVNVALRGNCGPPSLFAVMTDGLICFSQEDDANTLTAVIKSACEA